MIRFRVCVMLAVLGVAGVLVTLPDPVSAAVVPDAKAQDVVSKAVAFLKTQQQPSGSWQRNEREPAAVTALALKVLAQDPKTGPNSAEVKKAVAHLLSMQKPDGSISGPMLANYNTAIIVSALASLNDPALKGPIDKAVAYLKSAQWTEETAGADGQKLTAESPFYGGWGYGGTRGRPDLSNTAVVLDALKDSGLTSDDPAFQRAMKFVSRLQNLSETNPAPWAGNDGGFIYNPGRTGEGSSSAGEYTTADGKRLVRSYGSMTYAGMMSMIHSGLTRSDPRVKAAWDYVRSNWTLDENPGMAANDPASAKAGIYYYYNMLAKALDVYEQPVLEDRQGNRHDWRLELIDKLATLQKPDGSFAGDPKWMEDNPVIATTLAVLALQDAMKDLRPAAATAVTIPR